jgi:predicted permease
MSAPRVARWLTRATAPAERRADMLGDLEEVHARRRRRGAARAWLTTVLESVLVALLMTADRLAFEASAWCRSADVWNALRLMGREPFTTATAAVSMTVGIGLMTVAAATAEALLFSRLPFEGGDRFVSVRAWQEPQRVPLELTADDFALISAQTKAFAHVGAGSQSRGNVTLPEGVIDEATTAAITPASLAFLPYAPILGRPLTTADTEPGATPVVMIREAFWRRVFGGSANAVGATLEVDGARHTIVGVMPNELQFPNRAPDLWAPLNAELALAPSDRLFAILAPGHTLQSAQAELAVIAAQLPAARSAAYAVRLEVASVTDLGPQTPIMATAIIVVAIAVLAVVAANVANLVLARSFLRAHELAVRSALGASRAVLVRQITVEVLLLCAVAAATGSVAAQAVLRQFNALEDLPFWLDFTAGPRTFLLVIGATLLGTAIAGAWPALKVTRVGLLPTLQSGARGGHVAFGRAAAVAVIVQIAVSIVMLHGALVFADSVARYSGDDLDVPSNVLTAGLRFSAGEAASPIARDEVESVAARLPGVLAAGLTTALPRHSPPAARVEIEPLPGEQPAAPRLAPMAEVSAGYFATLDADALVGRLFVPADHAASASPVAVVNVPFVQRFLAGDSALGRRFRTIDGERPGPWHEIIGVVAELGLSVGDPTLASGYYVPLVDGRRAEQWLYLSMRVSGDPASYVGPLRQALYARDPTFKLNRPQPLDDVALEDRSFFKWFSRALVGLGVVTLILAMTGVYAMMAIIVSRRTREIGIRIALGATVRRVIASVLGRAASQVAIGGILGAALAVLSLDLRSVLVSRLGDGGPWALPIILVLLVLAGVCATGWPLRRALRVAPSEAMRCE